VFERREGATTSEDKELDIVKKTFRRTTPWWVRRRVMKDMAKNGFTVARAVQTGTGETILTFMRTRRTQTSPQRCRMALRENYSVPGSS